MVYMKTTATAMRVFGAHTLLRASLLGLANPEKQTWHLINCGKGLGRRKGRVPSFETFRQGKWLLTTSMMIVLQ
jgi:hypothetical protein